MRNSRELDNNASKHNPHHQSPSDSQGKMKRSDLARVVLEKVIQKRINPESKKHTDRQRPRNHPTCSADKGIVYTYS